MAEVDEAEQAAQGEHQAPKGTLTITAPVMFGQLYVTPLLARYLLQWPQVDANCLFLDRVVNLLEEGVDVAVRIGELPDSSLHAARVGRVRRVLVDRHDGKRLNSPNDVVVKSDGSIWFTDPPFGILGWWEGEPATPELPHGVYRIDPATGRLELMLDDLAGPNGLAFSPDESLLYVSDTSAALAPPGQGHHHIVAFDVVAGQDLANPRVFAVVEPGLADGFRVDVHGFVYTSSADSVQVYHPDGTRIGRIPVPEKVGNLCVGGDAGNELFICASSSLYRIVLNTRGATA